MVSTLTQRELEQYLLQSLNMGLGSVLQGETSYTNSFNILVKEDGFIFVPRLPCGFIIDDDLYQKIFLIANASLYPQYTLLKQNSAYFVALKAEDIHVQRGLFFPWKRGVSERLVIPDLETFASSLKGNNIPIMKNLTINYDKVTSLAIAGNSGSGKSYALTYLLSVLRNFSDLIIIDPKFDTPSRWSREHQIPVIHPHENRSKSDFVSEINESLSQCLTLIHKRQGILFENPRYEFKHLTIVIDEVLALSEGVNKTIKDSFFSLLSQIALLGRATRVHLLLVSQRFDHTTIPVSVREQLNVLIQIGNINKKTTQFLFPNLDPEGIVIPIGKGTGLIQIIDNEHPYQVLPLLCPTYYTTKGIL
ncbi:cell division protein FtsK [Streptococcus sp. 27098_8_91]|uniref:Cell division protein FtsK n=1 Tax=Streptococcus taonis TaxID=3041623 RepID=A0ABT6PDR9_9STRE|nr:cell division protein FtsK [Streptococcus sp. ST22-14]MDI1474110.1 cell division protein FtsK [Streptococcus sp. ST22-14]